MSQSRGVSLVTAKTTPRISHMIHGRLDVARDRNSCTLLFLAPTGTDSVGDKITIPFGECVHNYYKHDATESTLRSGFVIVVFFSSYPLTTIVPNHFKHTVTVFLRCLPVCHSGVMSDRQVFIGNLCNISNDILRMYCEKYGSLTELSINRDKENNVYHCFAFVTFQHTRSTSQFMSNRPHLINGEEVFVKRALPRATSSIPERLIVTNRLVLQDLYKFDRYVLQNYFRRFGRIKKIDTEHGIIDYEDYDDVDRVLLARPHYIRDQEISVTKFTPSEQQENSESHHMRSNYRHRSTANHNHRCTNHNEQPERVIKISAGSMRISGPGKLEKDLSEHMIVEHPRADVDELDDTEQAEDGELDNSLSHSRYEHLEEQFQEYKQAKEIEICGLRMDLERTKQQLTDLTQEKLDVLIKNQRLFHDQLTLRLFPDRASIETQTVENLSAFTPEQPNKKRKLSVDREYDYYS